MPDLSLPQRLGYGLLGFLYWFTHWTTTHRLLGLLVSTLLKLALLVLLLLSWARDWEQDVVLTLFTLTTLIFLLYGYARRAGYFRFVAGPENAMAVERALASLPFYKRVPAQATGVFSLETWEKQVLFRPAEYWQVPRGGHAVMVAHEPGRYLYQFFDAPSLLALQQGWILYGRTPRPALAISFRSIWGPELAREPFSFFGRPKPEPEPIERIIYLSFAREEDEQKVWQNIVADLRQARVGRVDK